MPTISDRPLVVWPNPFHQLDHKGRAACAVRLDPDVSAGDRRYVGATRKVAGLKKFTDKDHPGAAVADDHAGHYDLEFDFDIRAHEIPDTHDHRDRVRSGELIPGDASTARRASGGGIKVLFDTPLEVLKREQEAACELWAQEHDDEKPPAAKFDLAEKKPEPEPPTAKVAEPEEPIDPSRAARGLGPKPSSPKDAPAPKKPNPTPPKPAAPATPATPSEG